MTVCDQVHYEVFYPSPATSSISHNPKYIKQDISAAPDQDGEHALHGKPKKQHRGKQRRRIALKDIDECDLPSFTYGSGPSLTAADADGEDFPPLDDAKYQQKTSEFLLSSLIEKTERLQLMVGWSKSRRKKNSNTHGRHHEDDKSHIVYTVEPPSSETRSETPVITGKASSQSDHQPVSYIPAEATRVLLPSNDVTMASLKDEFGPRYFEASCIPRKFVLDITSNVRDLLKKQGIQERVAETTDDAISYLVCIHDGVYDDHYDVYKVFLNSRLRQGLLAVDVKPGDNDDLYRGTVMNLVSQTVDFAEGLVTKLKEENHFPAFYDSSIVHPASRQLKSHLASAEAYTPSVQRVFSQGSAVTEVIFPSLAELLLEEPAFCDICYEDVSPLTQDSAPTTALMQCRHRVCDNCWSLNVCRSLQQGCARLTCPSFDCQQEVKVGVLLSVAHLDTVEKLLQRQEEVRVGASKTEKKCPNQSCGRVIRIRPSSGRGEAQLQQDVLCDCGTHICFHCLTPAHWPASCKQAEDYRNSLPTAAFPDRLAEVHDDRQEELEAKRKRELEQSQTMLVEGKHCPKCLTFVYRDGGGAQMTCACGQLFCWFCTKPGFAHQDRQGCVTMEQEKRLTTTLVVRHLQADKVKEQGSKSNRRQRVSLMERAVEHRRHQEKQQYTHSITVLAKAVAAAAAKDNALSQHILKICGGAAATASQPAPAKPLASSRSTPSVLNTVTSFLKNVVRSKQELHEVVEYSLVLLKDVPESLLRCRALRICEDLGAFCSFVQSVLDTWSGGSAHLQLQEAVRAVSRLAEIQGWIHSAVASHAVTVRKLRNTSSIKH